MYDLNDITYEIFDLDPASFYATPFSSDGRKFDLQTLSPANKHSIDFQRFDYLAEEIARVPCSQILGFSVLDIGCNSGRFGAYIKSLFPNCRLVGVDMNEACIKDSLANGYDDVLQYAFNQELPFQSDSFDFVYPMDVFGHIEFRHKDRVVSEIQRVTHSGRGCGFHGIEADFVDYVNCNFKDKDDPVRKYVYIDGHIGAEDVDQLFNLFSKHMTVTSAFNWQIKPVLEVNNALAFNQRGEEFSKDLKKFNSQEAVTMANAVLGHFNRIQLDVLISSFDPVLTRKKLEELIPEGVFRNYVMSLTNWGGFAMITTRSC